MVEEWFSHGIIAGVLITILMGFVWAGIGLCWAWINHFVPMLIVTVVLFVFWRSRRDKIRELY